MTLRNDKNKSPYIIGVLSMNKKRAKFYIDVNGFLVSVSIGHLERMKHYQRTIIVSGILHIIEYLDQFERNLCVNIVNIV